ncbi:MAG: hypothetical protein GY747_01375 [Planctomycetes bacterium]|nr:hypothetical protein [Planctomycetota bacterium]MCP4769878.1 hypothetical protein [Planctomycetota bacterium]MCP4859718.1 hypothetical protein [Planctomycetota bacterium]
MKLSRILILLLATATFGACGSVVPRECSACAEHAEWIAEDGEALSALGYAEFPQAEPPRYEHDERTQKERDLEAIGRKN